LSVSALRLVFCPGHPTARVASPEGAMRLSPVVNSVQPWEPTPQSDAPSKGRQIESTNNAEGGSNCSTSLLRSLILRNDGCGNSSGIPGKSVLTRRALTKRYSLAPSRKTLGPPGLEVLKGLHHSAVYRGLSFSMAHWAEDPALATSRSLKCPNYKSLVQQDDRR